MGHILVTGFRRFASHAVNPSGELALALDGRAVAGRRVRGCVLPVEFDGAPRALDEALAAGPRPELVVALGLASSRAALSVERVAVNLIDAPIPDEAGQWLHDVPCRPGGPAAYFSTLPVKRMARAIELAGVPSELSLSAGSFVCNLVFYHLMERLAGDRDVRAGFVHVPALPDPPSGTGGLPLAEQLRGLEAGLAAALHPGDDLPGVGGALA